MMFKRLTICFISVFTIVACSSGPKKPKHLISKKKMINILIDAKLIATASTSNRKIMQDSGVFPNTYVFEKYNIDSLQFAESNTYYTYHIKDYEEIYQIVKDSLDKLKAHYKEIRDEEIKQEEEKRKQDSILFAVLKEKDSINLLKMRDSIKTMEVKDSLSKTILPKIDIEEGKLITPVSEK